jgi:hypothetical protein
MPLTIIGRTRKSTLPFSLVNQSHPSVQAKLPRKRLCSRLQNASPLSPSRHARPTSLRPSEAPEAQIRPRLAFSKATSNAPSRTPSRAGSMLPSTTLPCQNQPKRSTSRPRCLELHMLKSLSNPPQNMAEDEAADGVWDEARDEADWPSVAEEWPRAPDIGSCRHRP